MNKTIHERALNMGPTDRYKQRKTQDTAALQRGEEDGQSQNETSSFCNHGGRLGICIHNQNRGRGMCEEWIPGTTREDTRTSKQTC